MAEPLLQVSGVRKSYGSRPALRGIDLEVGRGEFVALLGPNGAGKTTLFALITGLISPDAGRIRVANADLQTSPTDALAALGVVFQQQTLDLDLSVEANLRFHAALHGIGRGEARARIEAALARAQLHDRARERTRDLSGGMRRKLELARAQLHRPAVLVMDEPTVGLDPASRLQLLSDVLALRDGGVGVLWATHLVDEAERADRVVVLHRGDVVASGEPAWLAGAGTLADAFFDFTGGAAAAEVLQ